MSQKKPKIAVIGGGIAGSSVALYLGELGLDVTLFEKESSLVSGPPMCHLHAGGNLYREIDDAQCIQLLKESIELLRFYPYAIDFRPTLIATPIDDPQEPQETLARLKLLQSEYEKLIAQDSDNKVLGESDNYFKLYSKKDVQKLKERDIPKSINSLDDWIIPVAKELDLERVKFPLILVQEYGLNVFRIAATAQLSLEKYKNIQLKCNYEVKKIEKKETSFIIDNEEFDYLINAAGFKSGTIDDMLGIHRERLVEFKAAYIAKWEKEKILWPEVVFFGQRGTPQGMAQFTPYPDGYFQLHGMTKDITLFEDGLVKNCSLSAQPKLDKKFLNKIDSGWCFSVVEDRTKRAIEHVARFFPAFKDAQVTPKPLYGAQQIPGDDATLRASEVSFEGERYARCEIVKASSILTMADAITKQLISLKLLSGAQYGKREFATHKELSAEDITKHAQALCRERNYPQSLAKVTMPQN